jgi:hypothetical protein
MQQPATLAILATAALQLGGCASIVTGHNQPLSVETRHGAQAVAGANCKLENDKGAWFVTTPGSVTVRRSYGDLNIRCEKPGLPPGSLAVQSSTKAMAFGNILFGGGIGAGVDVATGAAYDYPSLITVPMGESLAATPAKSVEPTSAKP